MKKNQFLLHFLLLTALCAGRAMAYVDVVHGVAEEPQKAITFSDKDCERSGIMPQLMANGEVMMPKYDGKHFFIDLDGYKKTSTEEPAPYQIEKAIELAQSKGTYKIVDNVADFATGLSVDFVDLPFVFEINDETRTKIVILSMVFTTTGAKLDLGAYSETSFGGDHGQPKKIYFAANDLSIGKGGRVKGQVVLIEPKESSLFNFMGIADFYLTTGTGICLGCEGNQSAFKVNLAGLVVFNPGVLMPEDNTYQLAEGNSEAAKLFFSIAVSNWNDVIINLAMPADYGYRFTDFDKFALWRTERRGPSPDSGLGDNAICSPPAEDIGGNIVFDFSESTNAVAGMPTNFKGVYFSGIGIRLPKEIKTKTNGTPPFLNIRELYYSERGFTVDAGLTDIQPIGIHIGEGFEANLKGAGLNIEDNKLKGFFVQSDLRLPISERNEYEFDLCLSVGAAGPCLPSTNPASNSSLNNLNFEITAKNGIDGYGFGLLGVSMRAERIVGSGTLDSWDFKNLAVTFETGSLEFLNKGDEIKFTFQELKVTNSFPFVSNLDLNTENNVKLAGFKFGLNSLNYTAPSSSESGFKIGTEVSFELGKTEVEASDGGNYKSIGASADLVFQGQLHADGGSYYFEFEDLILGAVQARADFPCFGFSGKLELYRDTKKYGVDVDHGFDGNAIFWFKAGVLKSSESDVKNSGNSGMAKLAFIRVADKAAWLADARLTFGNGIPRLSTIKIRSIFGGAYKNFILVGPPSGDTKAQDLATKMDYQYDAGSWGFKIGAGITYKNVEITAAFQANGKSGRGLEKIEAIAYAMFPINKALNIPSTPEDKLDGNFNAVNTALSQNGMRKSSEEVVNEGGGTGEGSKLSTFDSRLGDAIDALAPGNLNAVNRIGAGAMLSIKFRANDSPDQDDGGSFTLILKPDINITLNSGFAGTRIQTTGYGILRLSEQDKYLHLGRQSYEDRLGLHLVGTAGPINFSAAVTAYLMLGTGLPTTLPDPVVPPDILAAFNSVQSGLESGKDRVYNGGDIAQAREGNGLAMGFSVSASLALNVAYVLHVDASAGAGFDAILVKADCPSGWASEGNNWKASGQVYGYANASLKLFLVNIAEFGVGVLLRASVPDPAYGEGIFVAYLNIWKSKMALNFHGRLGDRENNNGGDVCVPEATLEPKTEYAKIIDRENIPKKMAKYGNLAIPCLDPTDQSGSSETTNWGNIQQKMTLTFTSTKGGASFTYNIPKEMIPEASDLGKRSITVSLNRELAEMIVPGGEYKVDVKTGFYTTQVIYEPNNKYTPPETFDGILKSTKNNITYIYEDSHSFYLVVDGNEISIQENDLLIYPAKDQFNVYPEDYSGLGYFIISQAVAERMKDLGEDFKLKVFDQQDNVITEVDIDESRANWETEFSLSLLKKEAIYQIKVTAGQKVAYEEHYFRISPFGTFEVLLHEFNEKNSANFMSGDLLFEIAYDGEKPMTLDREEVGKEVGAKVKIGEGNWFDEFSQKYPEGRLFGKQRPYNFSNKELALEYEQAGIYYLENGVSETESNSFTNTKPIWVYKPFDPAIYKYLDFKDQGEEYYDPIPIFKKGEYCFGVEHFIHKHPYFRTAARAAVGSLPPRFIPISGEVCFDNENDIDFNSDALTKKIILVKCQRDKDTDKGISFIVSLKNYEGENMTLPDSLKFTLNYGEGPKDEFEFDIAANAGLEEEFFVSDFKSAEDCPTAQKFNGYPQNRYTLEVENIPVSYDPPCIIVTEVTDEQRVLACERATRIAIKQGLAAPNCNNPQNLDNHLRYFKVSSYFSETQKTPQTLEERPIEVEILDAGSVIGSAIIEVNSSETIISMPSASVPSDLKRLSVSSNGPITCGRIQEGPERRSISLHFSENRVLACGEKLATLPEKVVYYVDMLEMGSLVYTGSNSPAPDGYYLKERNEGQREYYQVVDGSVQSINTCIEGKLFASISCTQKTPGTQQVDCNGNPLPDGVVAISYQLWTKEGKPYLPKGRKVSFEVEEGTMPLNIDNISSSSGCFETRPYWESGDGNLGCPADLYSEEYEVAYTYTGRAADCKNSKLKAPILTSSKTVAALGEKVSLFGTCPSGDLIWNNGQTSAEISIEMKGDVNYSAQCRQKGCVGPEGRISVALQEVELVVESGESYSCSGHKEKLTLTGCSGKIAWQRKYENESWQAVGGDAASIELELTRSATIKALCEARVGGEPYSAGREVSLEFKSSPSAPNISLVDPLISSSQNNTICYGESLALKSTACTASGILWSTGASTYEISPRITDDILFSAVCKDAFCESIASNEISIAVLPKLPKADISVTGAEKGAVCSGQSITLNNTNCTGGQIAHWYKQAGSGWTYLDKGAEITQKLNNAPGQYETDHTYKVICKQNIGTDTPKWCEGESSITKSIKSIDNVGISLATTKSDICSYDKTILTASGCKYGTIEWQLPGKSAWEALNNPLETRTSGTYKVRCNMNSNCFNTEHVGGEDIKQEIRVHEEPAAPTGLWSNDADNAICNGTQITLSGACATGSIGWNIGQSEISAIQKPSNTTYYKAYCRVQGTPSLACITQEKNRTGLNVYVHPIPERPSISSSSGTDICEYGNTDISSSACSAGGVGGTLYWKVSGGAETATPSLSGVNQSATYQARCQVWECSSGFSEAYSLRVHSRPATPSLSGGTGDGFICSPDNNADVTLGATGCGIGHTVKWYKNGADTGYRGNSYALDGPGASGSYSAVCEDPVHYCESLRSVAEKVDIRATPGTPAVADVSVCLGSDVNLQASNCSGTYNWSGGLPSQASQTLPKPPVGPHSFTVSCTQSGCTSASSDVVATVSAYPIVSVSNRETICSGSSVSLSASCSIGTLSWSHGLGGASPVSVGSGGYYTATCNNSGCAKSGYVIVEEFATPPIPSISGPHSYCAGSSITLSSSSCGPNSRYRWERNGIAIRGDEGSLGINQAGNYSVHCQKYFSNLDALMFYGKRSCTSAKSSLHTVSVSSPTISDISVSADGCNRTLRVSSSCGNNVSWARGGHPVGSGLSINANEAGVYTVICREGVCSVSSDRLLGPNNTDTRPDWVYKGVDGSPRFATYRDENPCSPTYNTRKICRKYLIKRDLVGGDFNYIGCDGAYRTGRFWLRFKPIIITAFEGTLKTDEKYEILDY